MTISGTNDNYWHVALQPAGGGATTYPSPDVPATQTVYTPPASTPCVSVQPVQGGTGPTTAPAGTGRASRARPTALRSSPTRRGSPTTATLVGNPADSQPLSGVSSSTYGSTVVADASPSATLLEAGNEMYFKGGVCDPASYGRLYLAGLNALRAAGATQPYVFNMMGSTGNCTDGTPSEWLRAALAANAGLGSAILANGVSTHPHGLANQNVNDSGGTSAVNAQENLLQNELGAIPPVYVTEFGYDTCDPNPNESVAASSYQDATTKLQAAYQVFLRDPNVKGIWYFQSHDYGTGDCWGFMNADTTTRPQFSALSSIAISQGQ